MQSFQLKSSAAELMTNSREKTQINIIDRDIEEALERLVQSLNTEAELSEIGAVGMEQRLLSILCNRLRMQRDFAAHPEINYQKIVRPIFLTGAGRSGSTKLHKLLSASGDFKFIRFWQQYSLSLRTGRRIEDPTARVQEANEFIRWFDRRTPQAKIIHSYETFEPEEETFLFDHARFGINYNITHASVPSFMQWYFTQDMPKQLEFLRQSLKYLQWQFHDGDERPWLLKNPLYAGMEPLLAQLFPDATLVATHRDPGSRVSSSASLTVCMRKAYSDVDRTQTAGPWMLEFMAMAAQHYVAGRETYPDVNILDIGYGELTNDSDGVAKTIYASANKPLSNKARKAMQQWEQENRQHKFGVFKHSLADYGITQEMVDAKFSAYNARFKKYF